MNPVKKIIKAAALMALGVDQLNPKGYWVMEHIRDGQVIGRQEFKNTIVNEGKNLLLNVMFGATAKIATWYMGLVDNASFTGTTNTDTASSHAGWVEFTTYSQATRPAWGAGTAASQSITNSSPAVFDITATATLWGILVKTTNSKGDTAGTLWSTANFTSTVAVQNGDQIKMTYTLSA